MNEQNIFIVRCGEVALKGMNKPYFEKMLVNRIKKLLKKFDIKTLDSMARGIPVVTTDWGIDGFADKHDNGCILANEPEAFAAAINDLTENQEHYRQAVDATRKYFERYLSWEANVPVIDAAFRLKG